MQCCSEHFDCKLQFGITSISDTERSKHQLHCICQTRSWGGRGVPQQCTQCQHAILLAPQGRPRCGCLCLCLCWCCRRCCSGMSASSCCLRWCASLFIISMAGDLRSDNRGRIRLSDRDGNSTQPFQVRGSRVCQPAVGCWPSWQVRAGAGCSRAAHRSGSEQIHEQTCSAGSARAGIARIEGPHAQAASRFREAAGGGRCGDWALRLSGSPQAAASAAGVPPGLRGCPPPLTSNSRSLAAGSRSARARMYLNRLAVLGTLRVPEGAEACVRRAGQAVLCHGTML